MNNNNSNYYLTLELIFEGGGGSPHVDGNLNLAQIYFDVEVEVQTQYVIITLCRREVLVCLKDDNDNDKGE